MDSIIINGGKKLSGNINISGAKNAVLPIMAACILTKKPIILRNIPKLSDVETMKALLEHLGAKITISDQMMIDTSNIKQIEAPYDIVRKMRASIWVLGPLLARFGEARVSLPGGCAIGARQVDLHLTAMEAFGATIKIDNGYIIASAKKLKGAKFRFAKKSVGATVNAILVATLADGNTELTNCAFEPEIDDLCRCLIQMGAKIEGIGTEKILVEGVDELATADHDILPDRIEAGTYLIAAAATGGALTINGINADILQPLLAKLQQAGCDITINGDSIAIERTGVINPVDIITDSFPDFATDLQAQFMALMILSSGDSTIEETIFENRFMHVPELSRMGAKIKTEGNVAKITGVQELTGAEVMASDLRASVSLIIAGLCAAGQTKVRRIYHLDRGYQNLVENLRNCGADIKRVSGDTI